MRADERHRRLHQKLEQTLGVRVGETLIADLEASRVDVKLLRKDIQALELRMDARLANLNPRSWTG